MFQWISTLGAFVIMVVYGVMALGAFPGLSDHPNRVGLVIAGLLGLAVAVGAHLRGDLQGRAAFDLVWLWAVIWAGLGLHRDARGEGARAGTRGARRSLHRGGALRTPGGRSG